MCDTDVQTCIELIRANLSDELLSTQQRKRMCGMPRPTAGHCYVAVEALWHLAEGASRGWKTKVVRLPDGNTHWWIVTGDGEILDPTAVQFEAPPDYSKGKARGLLTRQPSRRCQVLLQRIRGVLQRRPDLSGG